MTQPMAMMASTEVSSIMAAEPYTSSKLRRSVACDLSSDDFNSKIFVSFDCGNKTFVCGSYISHAKDAENAEIIVITLMTGLGLKLSTIVIKSY